jgi:hypothetical protein
MCGNGKQVKSVNEFDKRARAHITGTQTVQSSARTLIGNMTSLLTTKTHPRDHIAHKYDIE